MPVSGKIPDAGPNLFSRDPGARVVIRLICEDCGSLFYSAAATTMVERGERCSVCGGRLVLADRDHEVAVGAEGGGVHRRAHPGHDPDTS